MKIKNAFFVATVMAVALLAGAGIIASAQNVRSAKPSQFAAIILKCRNYGGQQDVAKNPDIINTTRQAIPAGKTLYWKSSDGDSGSVQLEHALAPNGKVGVNGKPGQSYTCSAWTTK